MALASVSPPKQSVAGPEPPSTVSGDRVRAALAVAVLGGLALLVLGALVRHEPTPRGDDLIYERMALHPFATHTFPFGYRLGLPLLVNVLPIGTSAGFLLLAYVAAAVAAFFAYLLMTELAAEPKVAAALATLMCVSPPFLLVVIRQGRNTDIVTAAFMMAATYFAVRRRYWQLAIALLLGVLFREAVLFVVPLAYAIWADTAVDGGAALRTLAVGVPAAVGYLAIRLGIHTVGETQVPGYGGSPVGERFTVIKDGLHTAGREARRLFTIYGPLWFVAPVALRDMRFARRGLVLVALCGLAMTFALDWGRMILLAAPVAYPAGALVLSKHPRWRWPTYAGLVVLAIGYAVYMDHSGVRTGIVQVGPPRYPVR